MQDFVNGEAFRPFSGEPTEMEINFQICWVAIAVEKLSRRRRRRKNYDASTNQSNNFEVSRKRFKPSTPGSLTDRDQSRPVGQRVMGQMGQQNNVNGSRGSQNVTHCQLW